MKTLTATVTIADEKFADMCETLATALGYPDKVRNEKGEEVDNPQSIEAFVQAKADEHMRLWIKNTYTAEKDRQLQAQKRDEHSIDLQ